ncbi:hypothetical protein N7519_011410 [Penicillium mononematosum]|uniref:uncharacterized protein n=1 Tax=Penicillium mononematosum TaxID=268346 RepID=UPI002548D75E|nr:uncharacterized protein N7519_011410 [Penicillium mononematosum]KAJ6180949.1 hypothetical protein N7519_011410 [Penicillium mononematosum]
MRPSPSYRPCYMNLRVGVVWTTNLNLVRASNAKMPRRALVLRDVLRYITNRRPIVHSVHLSYEYLFVGNSSTPGLGYHIRLPFVPSAT